PGTLHRGDMDKHVLPAVGGLNESVAFLGIEELHGTLSHIGPPLKTPIGVHGCTTIAQRPSEFSVVLESAPKRAGSKNRQNIERGAYRRGGRDFQGRLIDTIQRLRSRCGLMCDLNYQLRASPGKRAKAFSRAMAARNFASIG